MPLDDKATDSDNLGRVLTLDSIMQQPDRVHLLPDVRVGPNRPLFVDDLLLLLVSRI